MSHAGPSTTFRPKVYHPNPCTYCHGTKGLWYCDHADPSCNQSFAPTEPCTSCVNRDLTVCDFDATCEKYLTSQQMRVSCPRCRDAGSAVCSPSDRLSCYRNREQLIITQACEYCFRELQSTDGCQLGHRDCQRRRYLVGTDGPPFDLTLYAFIAGLPKAFQLPQGYCINPDQTRRSFDNDDEGFWPTGLRSFKQHNLPPTADNLPWIFVCKNTKDALQAQHPPYPGRFRTTPYVLGPQWGLDRLGTLQHNLMTLKKPQPPWRFYSSPGQKGNAATASGGVFPRAYDWGYETEFKIHPEPLSRGPRGANDLFQYAVYAFQCPGAAAVDENGVEI